MRDIQDITTTGEAIAAKIRDLRLREAMTGSTHSPRLTKKTSPNAVSETEQVDFETETEACRKGASQAPVWVTKAF